jgi:hypothetical protein
VITPETADNLSKRLIIFARMERSPEVNQPTPQAGQPVRRLDEVFGSERRRTFFA